MKHEVFTSTSTGMLALVWSPDSRCENDRTILYLHGAGAFGTGMTGLFEYPDLPSLLRDGLEVGCRVVIPSCHIGEEWQSPVISSFLHDLETEYGKPAHGYDLIGYSRGGRGAYHFAATDPARIRTLAVISARGMPELIPEIRLIPVFICHGIEDRKVPVIGVRRMYEGLREGGCNCELLLVHGDHFIVAKVLKDGTIFDWQESAI
ncbi:MAG: hypothetical protein QM601_04950 [Pseudoxanthomonas sp.]